MVANANLTVQTPPDAPRLIAWRRPEKAAKLASYGAGNERIPMSRRALALIAAAALAASLAAPLAAHAQATGYGGFRPEDHSYRSADRNYCAALSEKYVRYVGRTEAGPRDNRLPDSVAGLALSQCLSGDTASAIPVLERKLTDARVTLPPRS